MQREPRPQPERRERSAALNVAVAYYLIAGLIALVPGAMLLFFTVEPLLRGDCVSFVFGGERRFSIGSGGFCEQSTDLLGFVLLAVPAILLPTARRLRRDPPRLGVLVGLGAVVGIAIAAIPFGFLVLSASYYGVGPSLLDLLLFVVPLLLAVLSALVVGREAARRR